MDSADPSDARSARQTRACRHGPGLRRNRSSGEGATLPHPDCLGWLVDREVTHRRDKRLAARLRYARLRHHAVVEDVDYRVPRGLDRALFHKLAGGEWVDAPDNLILCGPTGVGKSWLACALGTRPAATTARSSISASPSC